MTLHRLALLPLALSSALALPARAQVDAGQLLREAEAQQQRKPPPALPPRPEAATPTTSGPTVVVNEFRIEGARRYDNATLQAELAPLRGQALDFAGLQRAADRIAERYRRDGWHAGAFLPEQDLRSGVLRILVVESRLGQVKAEGADALPPRTPRNAVERLIARAVQPGEPLNLDALARATAIANELPGARVATVLARGAGEAQTDVLLRIDPRPLLAGSVSVDNQDSISTGAEKLTALLTLASPTGWGDALDLIASKSQGKTFLRASASLPLGDAGWRVGASASGLRYRLVGDSALSAGTGAPNGAKGDAATWGLTASYPLRRGEGGNATAILAADRRATTNETLVGVTSDKRVNSASLTLQADRIDGWMGGGANGASLVFTHGRLDLARVATDLAADQLGPRTQGSFSKLQLNANRLQRLTDEHLLWFSLAGQFAPQNLDAGEKFSLGGPQGVRAYPLLEGSGDSGAVLTAAWRWILPGNLRLEAFLDHGWVRRSHHPFPGSGSPNEFTLSGAGLGVEWNPQPLVRLSAQLADRLGGNPAALPSGRDNDGSHRRPRAWLSATLAF